MPKPKTAPQRHLVILGDKAFHEDRILEMQSVPDVDGAPGVMVTLEDQTTLFVAKTTLAEATASVRQQIRAIEYGDEAARMAAEAEALAMGGGGDEGEEERPPRRKRGGH